MAAPADITIKDLSGTYVMNKSLSDDTDAILSLQGIGWLTRKAIGLATVTLYVKQYDEAGTTHIDIEQTATGGVKGTTEIRVLNWVESEHNDHVFGDLKGKTRWCTVDVAEDAFLKDGWLEGEEENGGPSGERHVQSYVQNAKNGWTANQIWGFAVVNGKRYHVRRVVVTKGDKVLKARLVYDFVKK